MFLLLFVFRQDWLLDFFQATGEVPMVFSYVCFVLYKFKVSVMLHVV